MVVVAILALFHKELELTSVDPVYADVIGLRTGLVRYGLLVLLALATVAGIQAVGVVLTSALLITPAATASLLTNRLPRMMLLSTIVAVVSGVIGLYASYYANYSSGASIVLTATGFFLLAWFWRTVTGRTA
jgi:ABC-type Mn2+/Zn2+ transport system permease subunit